ncbi:hypothetical protein GCM10029978_086500 [Actinoallomurus acanthiterrae]
MAFGGTRAVAVARPTARKPAFASAPSTRVARSTEKLLVTAPTTCASTNAIRKASRALRRGQRRLRTAISGAPTIIPAANADVSAPAAGMGTFRSRAMSGISPDSMNSDVPWANTARPRT